jgi:hypothetical protein
MDLWEYVLVLSDGSRHVRPRNDLRPHGNSACWCQPCDDDGVWVHNSMDGRELVERKRKGTH